jgi:hypothetical protein
MISQGEGEMTQSGYADLNDTTLYYEIAGEGGVAYKYRFFGKGLKDGQKYMY